MVGYADISRFGYGNEFSGVGAVATPMLMGGAGASNPVNSYFQSAAAAPVSGIGGTGSDTWGGLRTVSPGINSPGGAGGSGFGFNLGTGELLLKGLGTIGSLWQAWEANKLAKDQFKFQKGFANANLANQIQAYNTTLEDRSRSRAFTEGQSAEEAQAYIDSNRLEKKQI